MRLRDMIANARRETREAAEFAALSSRLRSYAPEADGRRARLCQNVLNRAFAKLPETSDPRLLAAITQLLDNILSFEGIFAVNDAPRWQPATTADTWAAIAAISRQIALFEQWDAADAMEKILANLVQQIMPSFIPTAEAETPAILSAPLYALLHNPAIAMEAALGTILTHPRSKEVFPRLFQQFELNIFQVSGINPVKPGSKQPVLPTKAKDMGVAELVSEYTGNTPLRAYFETQFPFAIPFSARFEHCHVLGGSGHGKTQLLQSMQLKDIDQLVKGNGSIVVIDSQGDMIRTIVGLAELADLSERIVLIDPNDIENPPCLNLFDFGLDRLTNYSAVDREKLVNGAIALYEYMFGALLGADLTQRQGVIFRYLARLMMVVPGATIHTLREFMEEPETTRKYLPKLDPTSKIFFETQFFSRVYDDTRQQILTRLWGVISNSVLARMFSNPHNKVDMFTALNSGSLILINTAKDLLKQDGCEILGRFFIALIGQAAQERAAIPSERRRATFVYIDEAQDYFDEGVEQLLNQARKYRVGLILAHQNLGQFEPRLQAAVMASTAIKLAGGMSAKDATTLARDMRCAPEFLHEMRKSARHTEFACFIRNVTPAALKLTVPFGQMEARPRMSEAELQNLRYRNARRFCASVPEQPLHAAPMSEETPGDMGDPLVL